jgi:ABC-type transport system involved in cytochrome c biogenesis permease subunit
VIVGTAVLLYALAGIGFITYLFWRRPGVVLASRVLFSAGAALHLLFTLFLAFRTGRLPLASPAQAASMTILLASLIFMPLIFRKSTAVLGAFFLPAATCALGMTAPRLQEGAAAAEALLHVWYPLHTVSVIAGEALFAVAFIASAAYLVHEGIIRRGRIYLSVSSLPPLKLLDGILSLCLGLGFVAISAGMVFGALWAASLGVELSRIAVKASAGAAMWAIFAFSLHQRFALGWSGRRTAVITIAGFLFMVLLFIGLNLVFPEAHGIGLTR